MTFFPHLSPRSRIDGETGRETASSHMPCKSNNLGTGKSRANSVGCAENHRDTVPHRQIRRAFGSVLPGPARAEGDDMTRIRIAVRRLLDNAIDRIGCDRC